jgi:hypothetical protein
VANALRRYSSTSSVARLSSTWLNSKHADDWMQAGHPSTHVHSLAIAHDLSMICRYQ